MTSPPLSPVAGVDGCRGGWCVVRCAREPFVAESFAEVLRECADCVQVAVDMPIGLGDRRADGLARRLLGPRRSSVFTPPPRHLLASPQRPAHVSCQAYNLFRKIAEVDRQMSPSLQERVRETHPELVWLRWRGSPCRFPKRTPEGRAERLALLPPEAAARPPRGAARDDLVDAYGLWRAAREGLRALPEEPEFDERGLRMEICW